jgi:membrane protein YqaA with SNARE-associated domain
MAGLRANSMGPYHLPHWLQATVESSGGIGLFIIAFLDSTFLPFPSVNDLLLMGMSIEFPPRMIYYAFMSTLGSVVGCVILYFIAQKGEEAAFHRRAGKRGKVIRHWIERYGFISLLIAALLPPPTPFKFFVLAAGALGMELRPFVIATVLARAVRFYGEGYFAVRYGQYAIQLLSEHKVAFVVGSIASVALLYGLIHFLLDRHAHGPA